MGYSGNIVDIKNWNIDMLKNMETHDEKWWSWIFNWKMIQTFSANLSSEPASQAPEKTNRIGNRRCVIEGVSTFGSFDSKHGQDQSFAFPNSYIYIPSGKLT